MSSTSKTILLINGPNLNLLGHREPAIYGSTTLPAIVAHLTTVATSHNITLLSYQSNSESDILGVVHECLLQPAGLARLSSSSTTPLSSSSSSSATPSSLSTESKVEVSKIDAIIINPGALTHTSVALRDALLGVSVPFVEVHISNVHSREEFRHHSYLSDKATAVIAGLGVFGYVAAIEYWAWKFGGANLEGAGLYSKQSG